MKKIKWLLLNALLFLAFATSAYSNESEGVDAEKALKMLMVGNERFVNEKYSNQHIDKATRKELIKGQSPFAIIVTCSDSRVSPEILFDQGLGDLFVIRTAGEVVDKFELGSIEYAVEHLGTKLIIVLGHESCGAVKAAVAGGDVPKNISYIVDEIKPAVEIAKKEKGELLTNSIIENVKLVVNKIHDNSEIVYLANDVKVVGAVYSLTDNKVTEIK